MITRIWTKIGIVGLAMLLSLVSVIPFPEASAGGTCVEENGWVCIDDETELRDMSLNLDGKYKLAADINLTTAWTPIGVVPSPFKGEFDGNGHILSNMQITSTGNFLGFFGATDEATIRNVRLINVNINASGGADDVGGIVGDAINTVIENSSVTGTVQAVSAGGQSSKFVGGVAGYIDDSTIMNSSFHGSVMGNEDVGGLVGYGFAPNGQNFVVKNSYAIGNVSGETNVGGFAGWLINSQIENSFASVDVKFTDDQPGSGFVANTITSTFSNNFWNHDLTPTAGSGADGRTTFQMKRAENYNSWPPSNAWKMIENASYPVHAELFDEISLNSLTVKDVTGSRDDEVEIDYEESNGYYEIPVAYDVDSIELNFNHSTTSDITVATKSSASGGEMLDNHYPEYTSSPAGWSTNAPVTVNGAPSTSDSTVTIPLQDTLTFVQIVVTAQGDGPESVYKLTLARDEGSTAYPHRISTADQLAAMGTGGYGLDEHYILTDDIDLSGYANWTPIGDFAGNFNGNNHVIDHLTITSGDYIGLFRQISTGGTVSHLHFRGVNLTGDEYVGGLAGINGGTVTDSSVVGEVTGNERVGGLVGMNDGGSIERSYAAGKVTGSSQTGGLAGFLTELSTVNESYAAAEVTPVTPGTDIGGLIGSQEDGATISRSYWDMSLFETSPAGTGLDTTDMKRTSSFSGWDFSTDWGIIENTTYPMHRAGYGQVQLSSIQVDGDLLSGFTSGQGSYSLVKGNDSPVTITPESSNPDAVVSIDGNTDVTQPALLTEGINELEIKVVSANEAWIGLYKLRILVDTLDPDISTTLSPPDATSGNVEVGVAVDGTGSTLAMVKWAAGIQNTAYFGAGGTTIIGPLYSFTVGSNGTYTVYVRDEAGNEAVQTVTVSNIVTDPPAITLTYNPAPTNGSVEISVSTAVYGEDVGNSIDNLRWAPGIQNEAYFASNGTDVAGSSFDVMANGNYTLYARDTAGNEAVRTVTISNIVTEQPSIILTYPSTLTRESVEVSVTTVVYGQGEGNILEVLRWASGSLDPADFAGSAGTDIADGKFTLTENGIVTVYARDKAGLETVERVDLNWIVKQPPGITHDYGSAASGQASIDIAVSTVVDGTHVGNTLDVLKWAKGSYTTSDFAGGTLGQDITSSSTFTVTTNGSYTLYARDIVGNETALTFTVNKFPTPSSSAPACQADHCISLAPGEAKQFEAEGLTLTIPANATNVSMTVMLKNITSQFLTEERLIGQVYEITKSVEGLFLKPVHLEFRFDPAALGENSRPAVFYYDEEERIWIELDNMKANGDNTVRGETNHFTKFAVLALEESDAGQPVSFSDMDGHWARSHSERAVREGFVSGYPDGTFRPNQAVTRAEFTVMLAKALKLASSEEVSFDDQPVIPAWAKHEVAAAVASGFITGYDDGTFRPNSLMNRAEMAVVAAKAAGLPSLTGAETLFADNAAIPAWARAYVAIAYEAGLIVGKDGNRFAAHDSLTRAEAVVILLGIIDHLETTMLS